MSDVMELICIAKKNDYKTFCLLYNDIVFNHLLLQSDGKALSPYLEIYNAVNNHSIVFEEMGFTEELVVADLTDWYYKKISAICENDFPASESKLRSIALELFFKLRAEGEILTIQWKDGIDKVFKK